MPARHAGRVAWPRAALFRSGSLRAGGARVSITRPAGTAAFMLPRLPARPFTGGGCGRALSTENRSIPEQWRCVWRGSAEIGERLEVLTGTGGAGLGDRLGLRWDAALSFAGALVPAWAGPG
jgi:hypothetical protein